MKNVYVDYRTVMDVSFSKSLLLKCFPTFHKWLGYEPKVSVQGLKVANSFFIRDAHVVIAVFDDKEDPIRHEVFKIIGGDNIDGFKVVWVNSNRELQEKHRRFIFVSHIEGMFKYFSATEFYHIAKPQDREPPKADKGIFIR